MDNSISEALQKIFNRPNFQSIRVLKVTDFESVDERGAPALSAAVTVRSLHQSYVQ